MAKLSRKRNEKNLAEYIGTFVIWLFIVFGMTLVVFFGISIATLLANKLFNWIF